MPFRRGRPFLATARRFCSNYCHTQRNTSGWANTKTGRQVPVRSCSCLPTVKSSLWAVETRKASLFSSIVISCMVARACPTLSTTRYWAWSTTLRSLLSKCSVLTIVHRHGTPRLFFLLLLLIRFSSFLYIFFL